MKSFSQRKGLKPVKDVIQKDGMDDDLRNGLWNAFVETYWTWIDFNQFWTEYLKQPIDEIPQSRQDQFYEVKSCFFDWEWNEVYDFLEFVVSIVDTNNQFLSVFNKVLERELSAYRLVCNQFVEITSDQEIASIEEAIAMSPDPVKEHLIQALKLLSNREHPDYRNSIKESISAVEAISKQIAGDSKTTLGKALSKIERKGQVDLNPSLKSGFSSIYGYTNDADGIRHALMGTSNLEAEDAKFMLISCSAFINYLIVKADKAGIEL